MCSSPILCYTVGNVERTARCFGGRWKVLQNYVLILLGELRNGLLCEELTVFEIVEGDVATKVLSVSSYRR